MTAPFACWRCDQFGHAAAECKPPPAKTEIELQQRFAHFIELRIAGRISTAQKRQWVKDEWKMYRHAKEKARQ